MAAFEVILDILFQNEGMVCQFHAGDSHLAGSSPPPLKTVQ